MAGGNRSPLSRWRMYMPSVEKRFSDDLADMDVANEMPLETYAFLPRLLRPPPLLK